MTTCSATSTTTGKRCGRAPAPGSDKCRFHGAGAPQVRAAAQRRAAEAEVRELADRLHVEVPEFASAGDAARYLIGRVTKRAAQFGALADTYGDNLVYSDAVGVERLRAAVAGERQWLESFAKVLSALAQAEQAANHSGYSEMRSRLVEDILASYGHAMVTVALGHGRKHGCFEGSALSEFTAAVTQQFKRVLEWRVRDAEGKYGSSGRRPAGVD